MYHTPEPIIFVEDNAGDLHFLKAGSDGAPPVLPLRTIIDVQNLPFGRWLKLEEGLGRITITLDGTTVVYERIGRDLHGSWICDLTHVSSRLIELEFEPLRVA